MLTRCFFIQKLLQYELQCSSSPYAKLMAANNKLLIHNSVDKALILNITFTRKMVRPQTARNIHSPQICVLKLDQTRFCTNLQSREFQVDKKTCKFTIKKFNLFLAADESAFPKSNFHRHQQDFTLWCFFFFRLSLLQDSRMLKANGFLLVSAIEPSLTSSKMIMVQKVEVLWKTRTWLV